MSISLDLALFLREQKVDKPLTLAQRGVLFTLMFRVGSNPFTWISQDTLAIECDISDRQLRTHTKALQKNGFLEITEDPRDKRKCLYKAADFLINYHQQPNRHPTKIYPKKIKNYRQAVAYKSENSGRKLPVLLEDTGRKLPVNSGSILPVISCTHTITSHATSTLKEGALSPKVKYESNNKSKEREEKSKTPVDNSKPQKPKTLSAKTFLIDQKLLEEYRAMNLSETEIESEIRKFRQSREGQVKKQAEWDKDLAQWLFKAVEYKKLHSSLKPMSNLTTVKDSSPAPLKTENRPVYQGEHKSYCQCATCYSKPKQAEQGANL